MKTRYGTSKNSSSRMGAREEHLLDCQAEEFLMRKGNRSKPLSEAEKKTNKAISRIRVRVEHVFGCMSQLGMDYVRSIGLKTGDHSQSSL